MAYAERTIKKRRRENKTDYSLRFSLLKSKVPRIVIRRTNKYFIVQAVEVHESQDKTILGITSKDLLEQGWDKKYTGSLKSVPAAYLTGILFAHKLLEKNKENKFILDLGMARHIKGNRIYAVAKGLVDGGLDINLGKEAVPSNERLNAEHLKPEVKAIFMKVKEKLGIKSEAKVKKEEGQSKDEAKASSTRAENKTKKIGVKK